MLTIPEPAKLSLLPNLVANLRLHSNRKPRLRDAMGSNVTTGRTKVPGNIRCVRGSITAAEIPTANCVAALPFAIDLAALDAQVFTDKSGAHGYLPRRHQVVRHGVGNPGYDVSPSNDIELPWATIKSDRQAAFHGLNPSHTRRRVYVFTSGHDLRCRDISDRLIVFSRGVTGKRLRC